MKPAHLTLLVIMNVLWAASIAAYKELSSVAGLSSGVIVTFRFGGAALCLLVLWPWLPGEAPRRGDLVRTAVMGCLVFLVGHRLQVLGVKLGSAGNAAVLMGIEPLLTSVAAAWFLRERIPGRNWAGFALSLVGVLLLNRVWAPDFQWLGLGASVLFISSFLGESAYSVMGKPLLARAGAAKLVTLALTFGTIGNLLLDGQETWRAAQQMSADAWLCVAYLAIVCTAIGYTLWYVIIRETAVNLVALTVFVQPVAGVFLAALWLGEPLHWGHFWGCLTIATGMVLGLSHAPSRATATAPPD